VAGLNGSTKWAAALLGLVVVVGGTVFGYGVLWTTVETHGTRITDNTMAAKAYGAIHAAGVKDMTELLHRIDTRQETMDLRLKRIEETVGRTPSKDE